MRRHLSPARMGIVLRSHSCQEHFQRRDAQRQAQCAVAIVGIDPVMAGSKHQSGRSQDSLMPRTADLEIGLVLAF